MNNNIEGIWVPDKIFLDIDLSNLSLIEAEQFFNDIHNLGLFGALEKKQFIYNTSKAALVTKKAGTKSRFGDIQDLIEKAEACNKEE
jgi:hypothetical protein